MVIDFIGSTLAFNDASSGGGVFTSGVGNANVTETIISNNSASDGPDWRGPIATLNNSLLLSRSGNTIGSGTHNLFVDPGFINDFVMFNGGGTTGTKLHMLSAQSPAVDFNSSSVLTEDQRHFPRPNGARFDIGAYERDANLQAELLVVDAKSSETHSVVSFSEFSNGKGTTLASNAVNDFVTYRVPVIIDDCADIAIGVRRNNVSAQIKVEYKTSNSNWITLNPKLDLWASSPVFKELAVITNFKLVRDATLLRFTAIGKNNANTSATGYQMSFDYVKMVRNAAQTCIF